jgi:hypothetical protein
MVVIGCSVKCKKNWRKLALLSDGDCQECDKHNRMLFHDYCITVPSTAIDFYMGDSEGERTETGEHGNNAKHDWNLGIQWEMANAICSH